MAFKRSGVRLPLSPPIRKTNGNLKNVILSMFGFPGATKIIGRYVMDKTTYQKINVEITVEYAFRANFNDSYYLETFNTSLNDIDKEELKWIDPYNGRSKLSNTSIAIKDCSDAEYTILENIDGVIRETKTPLHSSYICSEDYDKSMLLAAHIKITKS